MVRVGRFIKGILSVPSRLDSLEQEQRVIHGEIGRIYAAIESVKGCGGQCTGCDKGSAREVVDRSVSDVVEKFTELKAKLDRIKDVASVIAPIISKPVE